MEGFQLRNCYKNCDGLPATTNFNLLGHGDVELPQLRLEIRVHLQLEHCLKDARLELVQLLAIGLDYLGDRAELGSPLQSAGLERGPGLARTTTQFFIDLDRTIVDFIGEKIQDN